MLKRTANSARRAPTMSFPQKMSGAACIHAASCMDAACLASIHSSRKGSLNSSSLGAHQTAARKAHKVTKTAEHRNKEIHKVPRCFPFASHYATPPALSEPKPRQLPSRKQKRCKDNTMIKEKNGTPKKSPSICHSSTDSGSSPSGGRAASTRASRPAATMITAQS